MPLVTSEELLLDAQKNGYAVGAFNVENMEMGQAIVMAAEELNAPVILQTTPSTIRYASVEMYHAIVETLAKKASVPVVMHLDHGDSYDLAIAALGAGYTSVMIDGSHESFEDNITLTKNVVEQACAKNIPVEAELGKVGGKEDDLDGGSGGYTDPAEAKEFAERTGISSLAVAIGTAHGIYSGTPVLDVERLREIRKVVSVPLVLHGASGLLDKDIIECVKAGICKVNFATELRIAFSNGVKHVLTETPDVFDPKKYGKVGREYVVEAVKTRIRVCGADGKA
ncbi:class II fructose-bisphosphate aldolase [Christensenella tenuis]|jgi:tagatose 1,6-diphosphate aldolase GatY/KbaY|uniref:Tagatose-bisphosphate aldolase subunit GatY n=1 Tax=Christensenella tenuis TaxID=2763033 RepID=A0ABR7EAS1_9FIRM|nr:tagatose-bisphosphate aldolase subunit GatY [Christensenella tenuis]MBC5646850.1 tagatose-bisphosphate aldolase subunit GatY [Christensenella tenuis]